MNFTRNIYVQFYDIYIYHIFIYHIYIYTNDKFRVNDFESRVRSNKTRGSASFRTALGSGVTFSRDDDIVLAELGLGTSFKF